MIKRRVTCNKHSWTRNELYTNGVVVTERTGGSNVDNMRCVFSFAVLEVATVGTTFCRNATLCGFVEG